MYFLPFFVVLVWGNSVELCAIFPVVGGAIGGAISGAMSVMALIVSKAKKNIFFKFMVALISLVLTIYLCGLIGGAMIAALSA